MIEKLKILLAKASPGEWHKVIHQGEDKKTWHAKGPDTTQEQALIDAEFMFYCKNNLPELLKELGL